MATTQVETTQVMDGSTSRRTGLRAPARVSGWTRHALVGLTAAATMLGVGTGVPAASAAQEAQSQTRTQTQAQAQTHAQAVQAIPAGGREVYGYPVADSDRGTVFQEMGSETLYVLSDDGATSTRIPWTADYPHEVDACADSVAAREYGTPQSVVWRNLATGAGRKRALGTNRGFVAATPDGWVEWDNLGKSLVRVVGATGSESVLARTGTYTWDFACDRTGFAYSVEGATATSTVLRYATWANPTSQRVIATGDLEVLAVSGSTLVWETHAGGQETLVKGSTSGGGVQHLATVTGWVESAAIGTTGVAATYSIRQADGSSVDYAAFAPSGSGLGAPVRVSGRAVRLTGGAAGLAARGDSSTSPRGGLSALSASGLSSIGPWWVNTPTSYVPKNPWRLLDTRTGGATKPAGGSVTKAFPTLPKGTKAVVLNVTAVSPATKGWLTVYPTGTARPTTSSLNYRAGQTVANQVVVRPGTDVSDVAGSVSVYASASTHVLVDIAGYFPAGSSYVPVVPQRIKPLTTVAKGGTLQVPLAGKGGLPTSGVGAAVLNVTAVNAAATGWLTAWPSGSTKPYVSNVNYVRGQNIAALGLVKPGAKGAAAVYSSQAAGVIVDVSGYFPTASEYTAVTPSRQLRAPVRAGSTTTLALAGKGGIPRTGVKAVMVNVTMSQAAKPGWVTVHPSGTTRPTASNLNYVATQPISNSVIARVGADGAIRLYSSQAGTLIVDVQGWLRTP